MQENLLINSAPIYGKKNSESVYRGNIQFSSVIQSCPTLENQNYKKMSSHVNSNGHLQKLSNNKMLERLWRKGNPLILSVGM